MQFDADLFAVTMAVYGGLFEAVKRYGLPDRLILPAMLVVGPLSGLVIGGLFNGSLVEWNQHILMGLIAGLSTSGFYAGGKAYLDSRSQ